MKMKLTAALAVILCAAMFSVPASAQDHERNWEVGTILQVTHVHIKPGMFNAYINDLNGLWRLFQEEQMKDGSVVGYRMWSNAAAREDEPDLVLTVEYANWAAFDRGVEYAPKTSELVEHLNNPEVHVIPESGHMVPQESPNKTRHLLKTFIFANNPTQ